MVLWPHLVDRGGGGRRVKYDPRDLSAVFVELPTGDHIRVPYADIGRPAVTLWGAPACDQAIARGRAADGR